MSMSIEKTCKCQTYVYVDGSSKFRPDMVDICIHPQFRVRKQECVSSISGLWLPAYRIVSLRAMHTAACFALLEDEPSPSLPTLQNPPVSSSCGCVLPYCPSLVSRWWRISSPRRSGYPLGPPPFPSNFYLRHPRFYCTERLWPGWSSAGTPGRLADFWKCCACCWPILPPSCHMQPAHRLLITTISCS